MWLHTVARAPCGSVTNARRRWGSFIIVAARSPTGTRRSSLVASWLLTPFPFGGGLLRVLRVLGSGDQRHGGSRRRSQQRGLCIHQQLVACVCDIEVPQRQLT